MNLELRSKVEAVKQLKSKYYATSWEAWSYLKAQEDHSKLAQIISKDLHENGIDYSSSANEISNVCSFTERIIGALLNAESCHRADETKRLSVYHAVFPYSEALKKIAPSENQDKSSETDDEETDKWGLFKGMPWRDHEKKDEYKTKKWNLDYRRFLVHYFKILSQTGKEKNDYRNAFRAMLLEFMNDPYPYLEDEEGNKLSFPQVKECDDFFIFGPVHIEEDTESGLFDEVFWDWINGHGTVPIVDSEFNNISSRNEEESIFLFGNRRGRNIYERAKREQTLRRIDVQRKIALSNVVRLMHTYGRGDIDSSIDLVIEELDIRRKRSQKISHMQLEHQFMVERGREQLEMWNYMFMAIKINRKWIKEVLSR